MGVEQFRLRLLRTQQITNSRLVHAGGEQLVFLSNRSRELGHHIKATERIIYPGSAGFGSIGEATTRAAHTGSFTPKSRP